MTKISKKAIDKVLAMYRPEQRILLEADVEPSKAIGKFFIGPCYYVFDDLDHATDIEIQLCLNQLSYISVYQAINSGMHPYLNGKNFFELQKNGMVILESRKRFRRPIPKNIEITGELELKDIRERRGIVFASSNFQFEDRSCIGSLELAIIDR